MERVRALSIELSVQKRAGQRNPIRVGVRVRLPPGFPWAVA